MFTLYIFKNNISFCLCNLHCGRFRQKLIINLNPFTLNSVLPEGRGGFGKAKVVATTLNAFMTSTDPTITTSHVPSHRMDKEGERVEIDQYEKLVLTMYRSDTLHNYIHVATQRKWHFKLCLLL